MPIFCAPSLYGFPAKFCDQTVNPVIFFSREYYLSSFDGSSKFLETVIIISFFFALNIKWKMLSNHHPRLHVISYSLALFIIEPNCKFIPVKTWSVWKRTWNSCFNMNWQYANIGVFLYGDSTGTILMCLLWKCISHFGILLTRDVIWTWSVRDPHVQFAGSPPPSAISSLTLRRRLCF